MKSVGGDVLYIKSTREVVALITARGLDGILDPEVGARVYDRSYDLGLQRGEEFLTRNRRAADELLAA